MLQISRSVEYGLSALNYLASLHGELASAREVSSDLGLPHGLIAKILQRLTTAGLVASEQGVRGGYRLARPLEDVSFLELTQAIEAHHAVAPCADESGCERRTSCTVAGPVAELDHRITALLEEISLGQLLQSRKREVV